MKFKKASRFIDTECNLNNSGEMSESFHVIYPNKSKFEQQGISLTC